MSHPLSRLIMILALLAASLPDASAHNGRLAVAVPMDPVTIDGDLSDWPEGMTEYPIDLVYTGHALDGPDDCEAYFRVGYSESENALYIAVVVNDESTFLDSIATRRNQPQDGVDVYIRIDHDNDDSESIAASLQQYVI